MSITVLWFVSGMILLTLEVLSVSLVLGFFGVGACIAGAAAYMDASLGWQVGLFIVSSLLTLVVLRDRLKTVLSGRRHSATDRTHPLEGGQGVATRDVGPGMLGEVDVNGSFWRATAAVHIPSGTAVRVLGTLPDDELVLRVETLA
ncbi:MAG: NfeD family protein [Desulfovibrio sp.]|jgi:membrane protein implicated in regulation of membrane protease activity|nr:NfeD family protein [Desulfovibrio sp.]